MKFHRRNSALLRLVIGLSLMAFGYQNCTKAKFAIDEVARQKALDDSSVFGNGNDGNMPSTTSPGDDGSIAGGVATPGNDTSIPGGVVNPGSDASIPGGVVNPGNDASVPGGFTIPGNDVAMPRAPAAGNDSAAPAPTPTPSQSSPGVMNLTLMCPSQFHHDVEKVFAEAGEVKIVFTDAFANKAFCEIHNIRQQILQKHSIDISSCSALLKEKISPNYFVVEESVVSDFKKHKFNTTTTYMSTMALSAFSQKITYAYMEDKNNHANCDILGDPLLVQLNTKVPQPIELTSPDKGVLFDLLGRKANHEQVRVSWFATGNTENYFLVLPDEKGQVNGIDELFGDATFGPDKRFAKQGFAALAKYDDSRDHLISADDEVFAQLKLWKDQNLDGVVQASELSSLDEKGVIAIDLRYDKRYSEKDQHGNRIKFKSVVLMKDNSYGLVYDLWLRYLAK